MNRRRFLELAGPSVAAIGAGCSGNSDQNDIQDTDGDGVIDSEDYAPQDPEVQEKSDLQNSSTPTLTPAPSSTPTLTSTPTSTSTQTRTPTQTPSQETNQLTVNDDYWRDLSHITTFSLQSVTVKVTEDYPETDYDSAKLLVQFFEFPRKGIIREKFSDTFDQSKGSNEVTVDFDLDPDNADQSANYNFFVGIVPEDAAEEDIDYSAVEPIMETDPFDVTDTGIERADFEEQLEDDSGANYSRNSIEGAYQLDISGRTAGDDWTIDFFAYKSAHAETVRKDRGRSRQEYVAYELTEGSAEELASLLRDEADARGYNERESVEFAIDFTQALPYVPDDVSRGFDDYTKFILATMTEMGGDCEDTSIMLASILEADSFGYDMVLIQPPGHMAAGIRDNDPSGWYWELDGKKYSYIETTGQGWGVGDCPEEYQDQDARLHQV
ncbi:hypothetical protein SAMN04488065_1178 [Haloplanus vescus]|uniref:Transglutaminase-like superfamily protein n=1 Tax=Haloplanus vescus TaxID=555874 RepID=A0A1H3WW63_9EURY|nr:hypothetical protein [Haloplanus vescus]SDZ91210.1 hypothetical protein SAMN04488065_1178 [Haloplanus vescus]